MANTRWGATWPRRCSCRLQASPQHHAAVTALVAGCSFGRQRNEQTMQWSPHALGDKRLIRHGLLHNIHDSWDTVRPCCCTRSVPAVPVDAGRCPHMLTAAACTTDWQPMPPCTTPCGRPGGLAPTKAAYGSSCQCDCCLHLQLPVAGWLAGWHTMWTA